MTQTTYGETFDTVEEIEMKRGELNEFRRILAGIRSSLSNSSHADIYRNLAVNRLTDCILLLTESLSALGQPTDYSADNYLDPYSTHDDGVEYMP